MLVLRQSSSDRHGCRRPADRHGSTGQERKAPSAPQQSCAKHSEQDGQDDPNDDQTDDTESQARHKLDADPDPEERHAETQNSFRAHGDPRHATTFLREEMEGNTEQQRHQHRRRIVMIREESGSYGDDDRDKEPRHEQYQVLRQEAAMHVRESDLEPCPSHSGSDTALEMSLNVADKGPRGPRAWAVSRVSAFARGCSSKPNCTAFRAGCATAATALIASDSR